MKASYINVSDLVVLSGIRARGRWADFMSDGRLRHGLLYVFEGEATFSLQNGNTRTALAGQLIYIPKALKYKTQYTADSTTFVVINFELLDESSNPFVVSDDITVLRNNDNTHTIANIMARLELCGAVQNLAGYYRRQELFYRLLSVVYSDCDFLADNLSCSQIMPGVLLLKQTYLENLPVEVFAKKSNISVGAFRQLFHKQYNMSPVQYRNHLRISRAQQLLQHGDCSVAEVAYECGFENVGYFCRYYKKITGQTPHQSKLHI